MMKTLPPRTAPFLAAGRMLRLAWVILLCLTVGNAWAQTAPITSSGLNTQISGPTAVESATQYDITGGTRPGDGPNLFHSFGTFNVPSDTIANFLNETGLPTTNILARVTGGQSSNIFGTLQTTGFGNANLFLMNPAGIVFGPSASLNVGGSVAFTTADYLRLNSQIRFNAVPNAEADALLTTSPVSSFGFLGSTPGSIVVQGGQLSVSDSQSISLVGGDVIIESGSLGDGTIQQAQLSAQNGQIRLGSAASPGEFRSTLRTRANVEGASFTSYTSVSLTPTSTINVSGTDRISIRNGQFVLSVNDAVLTTADSPGMSNTVSLAPNSAIQKYNSGTDTGVEVDIITGTVHMNDANILDRFSWGDTGNIRIHAHENMTLTDSLLSTNPSDPFGHEVGNAGGISLRAPEITLRHTNVIALTKGSANAGDILFEAENLTVDANEAGQHSFISTEILGTGEGGDITVYGLEGSNSRAETVTISGQSQFNTTTSGDGPAGNINILTEQLRLENGGSLQAISGSSGGSGGDITVDASQSIRVSSLSTIEAFTQGTGAGGNITLSADSVTLDTGGLISAKSTGTASSANGGSIIITATDHVTLADHASITATSTGPGNAGNIRIDAGRQLAVQNSSITTEASQASGGNIDIRAIELVRIFDNGVISTSVLGGDGTGGNITIDPNAVILQSSQILAQAIQGTGGNITITTPVFLADQFSLVSASSQFGLDGTVTIQSPISNLSGTVGRLTAQTSPPQSLLHNRCVALAGGEQSSFILTGRDATPTDPGGWLSSPMMAPSMMSAAIDRNKPTTDTATRTQQQSASQVALLHGVEPASFSLRHLTPPGFLVRAFALDGSTGCRS